MKIDIENPQAVLEDILTRINNGEYVKVVRCRDCKWSGDDCTWCTKPSLVLNGEYISCLCIEPNWFCADGKRKEKTDEKD